MPHPPEDRIRKILSALSDLVAEETGVADRERLREALDDHGVDEGDLGGFLEWLVGLWWGEQPVNWLVTEEGDAPSPRAVRLLAEGERRFLSPEAQGYLVALRQNGEISWRQFETVIHLASLGDGPRLRRADVDVLLDEVVAADLPRRASDPRGNRGSH